MEVKNKVTLADIASRCKVGVPTVSRVLNNVTSGFSVKPEIRELIRETAKELHYTPNLLAKNLQRQRTDMIMIYGYDFDWTLLQYVYPLMLAHATRRLQSRGYQVNAVFPAENRSYSSPQMLDGALLLTNIYPELSTELQYRGIPYVILNDRGTKEESWLDVDDGQGTRLALKYLHDLGHRKIAYWGNSDPRQRHHHHKSVTERRDAYLGFMRDAGLPEFCRNYPEDETELIDAARSGMVTAILAYDTVMAGRLIDDAVRSGIRVPEQLSVIGFNRPQRITQSWNTFISSISMPADQMGDIAADILLQSIRQPEYREQRTFEMILTESNTTAKPGNQP